MHRLLQRQLKRAFGSEAGVPELWRDFIGGVNDAYSQADADRALVERSLELVSQELLDRNTLLTKKNEEITAAQTELERAKNDLEVRVTERTMELRKANAQLQEDILHREQAEAAVRESEERFRVMADNAPVLVWVADASGRCTFVNKTWLTFTGCALEQEQNDGWLERIHPEDKSGCVESYRAAFDAHRTWEIEYRMRRADGEYRWVLANGVPRFTSDGIFAGYIGSCFDITERKAAEEQLLRDAFHDGLTGLSNRALFMDRLERALEHQKRRPSEMFAVLFMDLDRFKVVNDSLGHLIGDQLLVSFAQRLQASLRPGDTVARLGGDEFTLLLDGIRDVNEATWIADRIHEQLRAPFNVDGHEIFTTVSIGIALSATGYERPQDLLRDADTALYRAKAMGKACHQVFDTTMHTHAVKQLRLETDLRRAVERMEFEVAYQPIVKLQTGCIRGFEALVRWRHPERGLLAPIEFIPIAEETGLIVPIGQFVLRQACRQLAAWAALRPVSDPLVMSVNLSAKQFMQPDMVEQIEDALRQANLPAKQLAVEITESVLMENADMAAAMLGRLQKMDIATYVDDFGTGYSSLDYLHRFPINVLKIDRAFIRRIGPNQDNTSIVETIITLARNLQLLVTAEGIETMSQLERLNQLTCEFGQGYLFSKPVDAVTAARLLHLPPFWYKQTGEASSAAAAGSAA